MDDYLDETTWESREDVERMVEARVTWLKELRSEVSDEHFLRIFASLWVEAQHTERQIIQYQNTIKDFELVLNVFSSDLVANTQEAKKRILEMAAEFKISAAKALLKGMSLAKISQARKGAKAKLAIDPKQAEKILVRECWEEWQKNPANYKSKAMFARDMLTKCESLTSQKKIEDWCRQWGAK